MKRGQRIFRIYDNALIDGFRLLGFYHVLLYIGSRYNKPFSSWFRINYSSVGGYK